ncbi:ribosomal large subunit pseudouridine synthase, RluD [Sulfurimonas gotlandica GD1]|uniref:RNA pseudouridylate synthase n=1 Tax=Sulfurimonas gotlandica (strain DSM 19862 / JCM 16533 / GD1) TaxID=929558 RepID=B6BGX6_SULGG|nr:RluA family pseudouridine synthase [Sulfurimonas gotlandica]EDZ63824.1 pseudouridine synthase D [Sulfurimonas gotlandica GD1]EHP29760.1 ribosomal large subunit pseudouridine synthase, RluD [Sulfurimonas gotlandica GD1]
MPFVMKKMYAPIKQKAFLYLIKELDYTQKEAQRLIAKGRLFINGEPMTRTAGEIEGEFEFIYFEPITKGLEATAVYDEFVVFDKPSGVLIHPQNRKTPYSLIDELKYQYGRDANIAHRIDQETSGLVLCAKNKESERDIKMMFEQRDMKKKYLALVHGELKESICIEEPLLRREDESAIVRMVVKVHEEGKASKTDIRPLKYFAETDMTLVECSPYTGRQHQIRVHLFHVKHPIVGDPIYGQSEEDIVKFLDKELDAEKRIELSGASRLLLHANELEFELYDSVYNIKSKVDFEQICLESMITNSQCE